MAKRTRSAAERAAQADGLRSRPARGRMLAAARELASAHGYEQLRVGELAERAGVSRETFYTHFADKRACLAEATAPRLGEVEQLLRIATEEGEEWAKPLIAGVDEQLSRRFDSERGPRARILAAMVELAAQHGFASVRLADIVEAAHVSYPSFYRCFESKEQCFEVARLELVKRLEERSLAAAQLDGGPDVSMVTLRALADIVATEPEIARVLLLEGSGVPPTVPGRGARSAAGSAPLTDLVARLLAGGFAPTGASGGDGDVRPDTMTSALSGEERAGSMRLRLLSGALVETMRERLLAGELERLPAAIGALVGMLGDLEGQPGPRSKLSGPTESPSRRRTRRQRSRSRTAATAA